MVLGWTAFAIPKFMKLNLIADQVLNVNTKGRLEQGNRI
jgi:hypothetical protein